MRNFGVKDGLRDRVNGETWKGCEKVELLVILKFLRGSSLITVKASLNNGEVCNQGLVKEVRWPC